MPANLVPKTNNKDEFKGLQSVLQKYFDNDNLKVVCFKTTELLPLGENYCSEMLKLDVKIRKIDDSEELLHLVAKTNVSSEKTIINWSEAFKKEFFVYDELLPAYRQIERESGIEDQDLIDILPSYIGSLLNNSMEIYESSILLMENLKCKDYYTFDKRVGLDVQHASKALIALARYHALGTAMKQKKPSTFLTAMEHAKRNPFDPGARTKTIDPICRLFQNCPRLANYLTVLQSSLDDYNKLKNLHTLIPEEPWVTINHGDFLINNIMFQKDTDDVKLVDFQTYFYSSPLVDLPPFFCLSLDKSIDDFDQLLDIYYQNFVKALEKINCDTTFYTRNAFDNELKKQAKMVFSRIAVITMISSFQVEKEDKINLGLLDEVYESESNNMLEKKMIDLVDFYEERCWF